MTTDVRYDFSGRVALVTGAGSGMGAAVATRLAGSGAHVVAVDRDAAALGRLAAGVGDHVTAVEADIGRSADCDRAVSMAVDLHGRLDVLVNAAGVIVRKHGIDTTDDDWDQVMAVNAGGVFRMCRAAVRHMATAGTGAVVNFGSIWGELGGPGAVAYCASKGAVLQITRAFALEHARDGVRFNSVCPGEVDTPMLRAAGRSAPLGDEAMAAIGDQAVPVGRLGRPEEIAETVVWLCSDAASYVTGATYYVDGGYSAR